MQRYINSQDITGNTQIKSQKVKLMKRKLCVSIDEEIIARIDNEKGFAPRSIIINELLKSAYAVKDEEIGAC